MVNPLTPTTARESEQDFTTRTQLGVNMRKGESVKAKLLFSHNFQWGSDVDATTGAEGTDNTEPYQPDGINNNENIPLVSEAWLWWKLNESMSLRMGRGPFSLGDGKVISNNDYLKVPYSLDGVVIGWSGELSHSDFFALKLIENVKPGFVTNDSEMNVYGLSFNVKNPPEIFKIIHFHVMQVVKNAIDKGGNGIGEDPIYERGLNYGRYGLAFVGGKFFQYAISYAAHSGEIQLGTSTKVWSGSMIDAELALRPTWKNAKIYYGYHRDTGNEQVNGEKEAKYDSFLYEKHGTSGAMDVLGWGNLTFWKAGLHADILEDLRLYIDYYSFLRSETRDTVTAGPNGTSMLASQLGDVSDESEIGSEWDVSVDHTYDTGLNMLLRFSTFIPGPYLSENSGPNKNFSQVFLQAKIQF
ncbi:MAG: alginate export family protein [Pseudomonadota bacterium]|nr:alginate export family protein [Pseudomonadota bacterium]